MALKLLGICRSVTQGVQRHLTRQGGFVIQHDRPSPIGFKVRFLASSKGGGIKDFKGPASHRMHLSKCNANNMPLKNTDKNKFSNSKISQNKSPSSASNNKLIETNLPRDSEIKAKKISSFTQSLRIKERMKDSPERDALKIVADKVKTIRTPSSQNGANFNLGAVIPKQEVDKETGTKRSKILTSFDMPEQNTIISQSAGYKEKLDGINSTFNERNAKRKSKTVNPQKKADLDFVRKNTSVPTGHSKPKGDPILPEISEPQGITRNSMAALNLEGVSKSMNHVSGTKRLTDLQNRDIQEQQSDSSKMLMPKAWLEMDEQPFVAEKDHVQNQNHNVNENMLERKLKMREDEATVNGVGLPRNLPDTAASSQLKETPPKKYPNEFSFTKYSSAGEPKTYLKDEYRSKSEKKSVSMTDLSAKKSLPEPFLCVMPEEIVKSKYPLISNKPSLEEAKRQLNSSDMIRKGDGTLEKGRSAKKISSPPSLLDKEKKEWLKRMKESIQVQNEAKSKSENGDSVKVSGFLPGSKPISDKEGQLSPSKLKIHKSNQKPFNEMTSKELLSALASQTRDKMAGEKVERLSNNKTPAPCVNESHAVLESSKGVPKTSTDSGERMGKHQLNSTETAPVKSAASKNASLGIVKNISHGHDKSEKSKTMKNSSFSSSTETGGAEIPDLIVVESFDQYVLNNPSLSSSKTLVERKVKEKGQKDFLTSEYQTQTSRKEEPLSMREMRSNLKSKRSSKKVDSSEVQEIAQDPMRSFSEDFKWPTEEEHVFPVQGWPPKSSRSEFHRDVCRTYLSDKNTDRSSLPLPDTSLSGKQNLDLSKSGLIRDSSVFPSVDDDANSKPGGIEKNKTRKENKKVPATTEETQKASTFEIHPWLDKSLFSSLDGFMVMEAIPVETKDVSKQTSGMKNNDIYPLFHTEEIDTGVKKDLSSHIREPVWSMAGEQLVEQHDPLVNNIFLDEQIKRYEMILAKYHERSKEDKDNRRSKKEPGKKEKSKKKSKREKKNQSDKSVGETQAIYV